VPGLLGAKVSLEMPAYDAGNTPITAGNTYTFVLSWTAFLNITVTGFVTELTPDNSADGAPTVKVGAQISGAFVAALT
jgi:hypothetical protein